MATTLSQTESEPTAWPSPAWAWQRLESWINHRWASRTATWVVQGPGEWLPPLGPVVSFTVECWDGTTWAPIAAAPTPLGGIELPDGTFRINATVGDDSTPPAAVTEAITRLEEFSADGFSGLRRYQVGDVEAEADVRAGAKALALSGAADLLKPWRRPR